MKYQVSFRGRAVVDGSDDADEVADILDSQFTAIMDHLVDLEDSDPRLSDADLSAKLSTGEIEFEIVVDAERPDDAAAIGLAAVRSAIHAAGGYTPAWEAKASARWALEFESSEQKPLGLANA